MTDTTWQYGNTTWTNLGTTASDVALAIGGFSRRLGDRGYEPASTNEEIRTWNPGDLLRLQQTTNARRRGETYELLQFERDYNDNTPIYISTRHIKTGEISTMRSADRFVKV